MLVLTPAATEVIHDLTTRPGLPADTGLRIAPNTDNTTGPAFAVSLSHGPSPDDQVIESGDARIYLEPEIAGRLQDKVLDAQVDDQGQVAFRVTPQSAPPS
jgi:Fe-S cluster assembly iron-binding protein IscA